MQVVEELQNLHAPNVFLFTADEAVTMPVAQRIVAYQIYLVVWDAVKTAQFADLPRVLGYTQWASVRMARMREWW